MLGITARKYSFCGFLLDADERLLFDHDNSIQLPPKVFDTLVMLVENNGKVLSKERMLEEIWQGSFVEENNLAQNISTLRRILREGRDTKYIETVPKTGYRFVADVEETGDVETDVIEKTRARFFVEDEDEALGRIPIDLMNIAQTAPLPKFEPETHYVQNGDVNIAYQVVGTGDVDIVFVMGWVSHLEYFWKHHLFASFLNRLASFSRLILFDKRGTGLSDRVPINELPTLEQRMEDVHAVMDTVGSERAILIGVSEGGPMCSLFAATYPERTSALVMIGTYAKRIRDDDYPWAPTEEQRDAFFELMQTDWGKPVGIDERAPSMANDEEFREWWATYLRMGASPGAAVALTKMNAEIDVRDVLPSVRVPTLVIHRSGDMCLAVEGGRFVASKIPGAKYVELGGIDHLPFVGDQEEILDEIEQFVTGIRLAGEYDRVLATVMSIKIVDAADEAARRGEEDWIKLFDSSREYVRRQLALFKGKQISYDASGVLAVFDGPARAIRCAAAITESAGRLGVKVKTGLHTGECDVIDNVFSGFAVKLAKEIAGESGNGNILVSRTVKDLVAGSGLTFADFGVKSFDQIDGEWRLFNVNP
jgi:pimeloyl-ACP methyl ester carboxylesterase/DNA-binding winged helix-turn-helix (wHTH) protein/class 3 adenylate cyclase